MRFRVQHVRSAISRLRRRQPTPAPAAGRCVRPPDVPASRGTSELKVALDRSGGDPERLWCAYVGLGGRSGWLEFEAYLYGALVMDPVSRLVVQHAAWELDEFTD